MKHIKHAFTVDSNILFFNFVNVKDESCMLRSKVGELFH